MDLPSLVTRFRTANWTREFADKLPLKAPCELTHADLTFLVKQAQAQLGKRRASRAANWAALGLYLDRARAVAHFKRVGLFRASKYGFQGDLLRRLVDSILESGSILHLDSATSRYLESVRSLSILADSALGTYNAIVKHLDEAPEGALKSLVVTVDRIFLQPRQADSTLDCDDPGRYTLEEHAEALSYLIHTFATLGGIQDSQFDSIDEGGIEEGIYHQLLVSACKLRVYHEVELLVDVFSYSASNDGNTIHLRPDDARLEQSVRLGYIHFQFQKQLVTVRGSADRDDANASLHDFAQHVYERLGSSVVKRRDQPFPRYVLALPTDLEDLIKPFREDGLFKEDLIYLEGAARELYVQLGTLLQFQLANKLTILDVVKIRRFLNFLREVMAHKLVPILQTDPPMVLRSLLPVFHKDSLLDLLALCVSRDSAEAFLRVATYNGDSRRGVFDVQYQPLILGEERYLVPMNVLCSSDVLRNLMYTERTKIHQDSPDLPMQRAVAGALRTRFGKVAEGAKLRVRGRSLEIDVVAVVERTLLVIECKSAFHPCGVHELRTSYEHIQKGRKQLDRLREALEHEEARCRLGQSVGWDLVEVDQVRTCVVTGNRIFNGYVVGEHPVRPAYELINMVVAGRIKMGDEEFCVWRESNFEAQDLLDYLAGTTVHADFLGAFRDGARTYVLGDTNVNVWTYLLDAERFAQTLRARYRRARAGKS